MFSIEPRVEVNLGDIFIGRIDSQPCLLTKKNGCAGQKHGWVADPCDRVTAIGKQPHLLILDQRKFIFTDTLVQRKKGIMNHDSLTYLPLSSLLEENILNLSHVTGSFRLRTDPSAHVIVTVPGTPVWQSQPS